MCGRGELLRSTSVAVPKDGGVVGQVPRELARIGLAMKLSTATHTQWHTYTCTFSTCVHLDYVCMNCRPQTGSSGPWGEACNGGKITLYRKFA